MAQLMCKHAIMASNRKTKPILKNKTYSLTLSKEGIEIQSFKWDHQVPSPYTTLE